ncbi:N-acetylglucosaminyldiphosphodolichol N-acetylglucosaminyltransferase catalytic subunit alg13 [Chytriomyces hyalinus]|nr:N-acetylglucosaminyldiphosphodolichol N-acetylglucosaminyltransferase catalytic subunit alg13 [Chytriomyces hyalinus]
MSVFVTVGTTQFDALVDAVTSKAFIARIAASGITQLTVQHGTSKPQNSVMENTPLRLTLFDYSQSLHEHMSTASIVISHAGAGSLLECLRLKKCTIAVPNATLMHNHQAQLADRMHQDKLVVSCNCDSDSLADLIVERHKNVLSQLDPGAWDRGRDPLAGSRNVMRVLEELVQ